MKDGKTSNGQIGETLATLHSQITMLVIERDRLRSELKAPQVSPTSDKTVIKLLTDAYNNVPGWREEARTILGISHWIDCENCGKPFRSGGKRKKTCSAECRFG
jgi:hypothetical protein